MVTLTNGSMWLSPPFPWSRSARWSLLNIARCLVFNIAGVARASAVSSAGSFPLHPLHSLIWMSGLDVVGSSNVPANDTPSFVLAFVLHVLASSLCSTLGNGWSGRPPHPFPARSQPCTGQRPHASVGSWRMESITGSPYFLCIQMHLSLVHTGRFF